MDGTPKNKVIEVIKVIRATEAKKGTGLRSRDAGFPLADAIVGHERVHESPRLEGGRAAGCGGA